jgi:NADPH-dependent glutamate synthase beta subunit-like oxidoreductase/NAD-dependent dihydropyrimidine dehydrogenase PreA subunit
MAYRFLVNEGACINCGICMDLCPVRCLDMTRPQGMVGAPPTPIPFGAADEPTMMALPVQIATCLGCQVCAQECPTQAITIEAGAREVVCAAPQGPIAHPPAEDDGKRWYPLQAYTAVVAERPGEAPYDALLHWQVAHTTEGWQIWRSWLGEANQTIKAPCQEACPVGTNAGLYVGLIAQGRYEEALAVAAEPNPFPVICGRVCTAPCEDACRRGEFEQPIAIRDLKRFASDHGSAGRRFLKPPKERFSERVAIIGSGPTGLSAAYYLARRGYQVTIYEAMPVAGGMMSIGIPEYRLPRAELNRDIQAIVDLGVEVRTNTAIGRDVSLDDLRREYQAVLIAVGAQKSQRLGLAGEERLEGVIPATGFLKDFNLGVETNLSGKVVAVVGGGSTAMDAARSAWRSGAQAVHLLYRRTQAEMPAQKEEVRAALEEGLTLHELVAPVELKSQNGMLTGVICQRMKLGEPDEEGRRRPVPVEGSTFDLAVDVILVAIGEAPDPSFLPEGTQIEVAAWGGLLINPKTLATGQPGVFAAGDATYGPRSIIHAAAHGRQAARSIHAYLRGLPPEQIAELPEDELQTPSTLPDDTVEVYLAPLPRAEMPLRSADQSRDKLSEFALGFTEAQARAEAQRCLRCDLAYLCPTIQDTSRTGTQAPLLAMTHNQSAY